ncbi:MAG TPA: 3'(2'),5'-bisphosphate nucleotidase CysQ [Brevundimonas sp.]|jgi:3'(2'), 5'-bisphosphate nucleotidase|uniref:3'(2'),5'-bisphosphate nucleotidase CysQ n=1 Tax=Brevundimonas sp. TaxID=1871086 RepID=UPI002DEE00EA|nr:3'(2'),5'-bisphosphate nucleotidase CysQ [Brevundimonas sp.]
MTAAPSPLDALAAGTLIDALADIAEAAASVIRPYWRTGVVADAKADDSPVTRADREAEALILERLSELWPQTPAVAEEASEAQGRPETAPGLFWLVDPLDGTRGFVRGDEQFTVNIALIRGRRPVAGVVTAPALNLTWAGGPTGAVRRHVGGAWETIRVRPRPAVALALMSRGVKPEDAAKLAELHGCVEWRGEDSSLKFCRIAEGACDVYPRTGPTSEWDTAAGQAVLEAAGGRVLGPDGAPLAYGKAGFMNGAFTAYGA